MDEKTGKMMDILIEDIYTIDEKTGMKILEEYNFNVWADEGMMNFIKDVADVTNVFDNTCSTQYHVFLDPRYDREFVKKEIEATIMCV